jgi:hypothetical protein
LGGWYDRETKKEPVEKRLEDVWLKSAAKMDRVTTNPQE